MSNIYYAKKSDGAICHISFNFRNNELLYCLNCGKEIVAKKGIRT